MPGSLIVLGQIHLPTRILRDLLVVNGHLRIVIDCSFPVAAARSRLAFAYLEQNVLATHQQPPRHGVKLEFSRPSNPADNVFIESFNGRLRQEGLNQNWFLTLEDARKTIEAWRQDYNEYRFISRWTTNTERICGL
jgi:transposase InsO family protein